MEHTSSHLLFLSLGLCLSSALASIHTTGGTTPNTIKMSDPSVKVTTRIKNATQTSRHPDFSKTYPDDVVKKTIEQACSTAKYKDFCISTLSSHKESKSLNLKNMVFLAIRVAKDAASDNIDFLSKNLANEENLDAGHDQAFNECADQYSDALAQLEDSLAAFFSDAYKDIETWIGAAITNANSCLEDLKESGVEKAMGDRNEKFAMLCSNALAVTSVVSKNSD